MSDAKPKRNPRDPVTNEKPAVISAPASLPPPPPVEAASEDLREVPSPSSSAVPKQTDSRADPATESWTALADAQTALARGFAAFALEATALTRAGSAAVTDAALALLGARTFAEAVEINATLARREVDALVAGGAKLSEIGVTAWRDASRPILSQFGAAWNLPVG